MDFNESYFNNLPMEIIIQILGYLSPSDLQAVGLTCHRWFDATQHRDFKLKIALNFIKIQFSSNSDPVLRFLNSFRDFPCITLTDVDFGEHDTEFWQQFGTSIELLTIASCDIREKTFNRIIRSVPNLKSLKIEKCRELFMSGRLFDSSDNNEATDLIFSELNSLSITHNRYLSDAIFNRVVALTPNIKCLDLSGCHISFHKGLYKKFYPKHQIDPSESVLTFHFISQFIIKQSNKLESLTFSETLIDGTALSTLATIDNLVLKKLELISCDQLTNDGIIALVKKQINLIDLNLSRSVRLTDHSLIQICNNLENLKKLKLRRCRPLSDAGIKEICKLKNLEILDISECENVTDVGIIDGIAKEKNLVLKELYVSGLNIGEKSVLKIIENFPELRVLDLGFCFNGVTELAIQLIFKNCRWLRELYLDFCENVSDASLTGMNMGTKVDDFEITKTNPNHIPTNNENIENNQQRNPQPININIPNTSNQYKISLRSKAEDEIVRDAKQKQILMEICEKNLSEKNQSIYSLGTLKGLRILKLTGCNRVTDVTLRYSTKLPELKEISLSKCQQISIVGITELVKNCPSLEIVNLSECHNINDKAIDILTINLTRLSELYLERCTQLTDFSLDSIIINCKNIKKLDIRGCRSMSSEPNLRLSSVMTLRDIIISKPGPYVTPILINSVKPIPRPPIFPF